ncbi:MAG: hypothetical protein ABIT23_07300 [Nitrosospira sp.]
MKTKSGNIFAVLSMVGLLASLSPSVIAAQPVDTPEIRAAAQNATTPNDHEAVAKYYENAATQMQVKVEEQKELLEHYEDKSYLYGRRAQDLQSHTAALVRHYEKTVRANIQEAALHRQMASKLEENHAASGTQALSAVSEL